MRILHLIHSEGVYGAERILMYLAREQMRRGHSPVVGSIRDPGTAQTAFEAQAATWGLNVIQIRIAPRPTPGVVRSLLRTVRAVDPDVLHSHGYKSNILLGPLPRRVRGPMLSTLHGWTGGRRFGALWVYECLDKWALRYIDAVVPVTRSMLALPALRDIQHDRLHVIENGIPPLSVRLADLAASARPLSPELVEFTARRPTLVAIGRLSAEKGFSLLLDAFARARTCNDRQYQLLIVGEGRERDALKRRLIDLGLTGIVRLAGYVEGADRLLQHASGLVVSSLTEGMPLVLLEAMQWRVPIVATRVGAIPELLGAGSYGHLVIPNDTVALDEGLQAIMSASSDDRVSRADAAVNSYFTSERMAERYLTTYEYIVRPEGDNPKGISRLPTISS